MGSSFDSLTFLSDGSGFHYISQPPSDLSNSDRLTSATPNEIILCALERLKIGDWTVLDRITRLLDETHDAADWMAIGQLLAYASPWSWLARLERSHRPLVDAEAAPESARWLAKTLIHSMGLWVIDPVLDLYRKIEDRDTLDDLEIYLSLLLESEDGQIFAGRRPPEFEFDPLDRRRSKETFCKSVQDRADEIKATFGSTCAVLEGETLSVTTVAERLLYRASHPEDSGRIDIERMAFEANTGINCTAFFDANGKFQSLAASAILEEFLDSGAAANFLPGVRYFFGHPIPS